MLEDLCGIPVLGVVPMFHHIVIEEEDSVQLTEKHRDLVAGKINIAVVLLRHMSNFTDFNVLERDERINLFYTNQTTDLERADIIILPGTKSTLDDLYELRRSGMAQAIIQAHKQGKMVVGICGGYQMLGTTVSDPDGIEGSITQLPGLGLLPISTVMRGEKITRQVEFEFEGTICKGYEIHQGNSDQLICQAEHCIGTYIHGFFDNPVVVEFVLNAAGIQHKAAQPSLSIEDFKEQQYDELADFVRKHVDINRLYTILNSND